MVPGFTSSQNVNICEGGFLKLPDGLVVSEAGTYITLLNSAGGCDSTVITVLTVNPIITEQVQFTICEGDSIVLADGSVLNEEGNFTFNYVAITGCDSIVSVQILIDQITNLNVSADTAVCSGGVVIFEASGASAYQWSSSDFSVNGFGPQIEISAD